ncbi:MAG: CapA family protein [Lachnospiraceae bacterium]|nr:CapA family protein [Lachnospiraceae bacterium]
MDNQRNTNRNRTTASNSVNRRRMSEAQKAKKKKEARLIRILTYLVITILIAVIVLIVVSCNRKKNNNDIVDPSNPETIVETETKPTRSEVELVAVGDVLMHTPLLNYADNGDGTYDFNSIFDVMRDDISRADIAVCNQETPVDPTCDPDGGIHFIFNTPPEIVDAEINAGFDIATQCSNHTYDMGWDGILHTVDYWKSKSDKIKMIGANASQEERDTIFTYNKNGITFAMLNYTYGLNGFELPEDMPYLVTIIDDYNYDLIKSDISRAKELADFVIVFPHWGSEDVVGNTTDFQDYWAKVFTEAGADLIIGTHPHVCERIDWVTADNGNKALCYYSIGNYASNQQETPEVLGGMAKVKIVKENGKTYIDESATGVVPVVTHNENLGGFTDRVVCYKLSDYTEDLAYEHDIYVNGRDNFSLERLHELADEIFGKWIISY